MKSTLLLSAACDQRLPSYLRSSIVWYVGRVESAILRRLICIISEMNATPGSEELPFGAEAILSGVRLKLSSGNARLFDRRSVQTNALEDFHKVRTLCLAIKVLRYIRPGIRAHFSPQLRRKAKLHDCIP